MGEKITVSGKRRRIRISYIMILLVLLITGAFIFFRFYTKKKLHERIEAIRATGHPVTLEELDKWYSIPDDAKNSAYLVIEAIDYYKEPLDESLLPVFGQAKLPKRTEAMPKDTLKLISQFLSDNQKSLELLYKTYDLQYGRYPVDFELGILPHLNYLRNFTFLLQLDSIYSAEYNNSKATVNSIKSIFGVTSSISKEPLFLSQFICIACQERAVSSLEYAINRVAFSDEQLVEFIRIFSKAVDFLDIKRTFDGMRCMILSVLENPATIPSDMAKRSLPPMFVLEVYKALGITDKEALIYLDLEKEYLDAFELPLYEQINSFKAIEAKINNLSGMYIFLHIFMPSTETSPTLNQLVYLNIKIIAEYRAAQTALAVQRYRLKNGKLPESITELVPDYLESIPLDPYDGKNMRYKKIDKGFVIYSIGEDLIDDSGKEEPKQKDNSTWDITFIIEK